MEDRSAILLHGAGVGAWVWDRVQARLAVPSLAPEVGGREVGATPDVVVDSLMRQIDGFAAGEVVLVAHSLTGVLVSGLAARLGSRLTHVVYVSAVIPKANQSFLSAMGFPMGWVMRVLFLLNPKGLRPSDAMIRDGLCNDLDSADAADVVGRYTPEFPGLYTTAVAGPAQVRSTYVRLTQDGSVSLAVQDRMIAGLGTPEVTELEAGHLPMLSRPDEIAGVIDAAASA
ncbi:MAG: alpha/beta hydrolase [Coriobacteriia bacterium]|nr:alpha/beta hydrolase [Coriobacteriia bacterium]